LAFTEHQSRASAFISQWPQLPTNRVVSDLSPEFFFRRSDGVSRTTCSFKHVHRTAVADNERISKKVGA